MRVVVGICEEDGRILMGRRFDHDGFYGGYWEFPGGKVDPGETEEQALVREFREELKAEIEALDFYKRIDWQYPHRTVELCFYKVKLRDREISHFEKNAHSDLSWLSREEALSRNILPANVELIKSL